MKSNLFPNYTINFFSQITRSTFSRNFYCANMQKTFTHNVVFRCHNAATTKVFDNETNFLQQRCKYR